MAYSARGEWLVGLRYTSWLFRGWFALLHDAGQYLCNPGCLFASGALVTPVCVIGEMVVLWCYLHVMVMTDFLIM